MRLFADQAAGKRYRVLSLQEHEGPFTVHHFEAPCAWLHAFLFEWQDGLASEVR